jgi:hypothetical protein
MYATLVKSLIYLTVLRVAGEPGFEPRLTESESAVLPLNYSPRGRIGRLWSKRAEAGKASNGLREARSRFEAPSSTFPGSIKGQIALFAGRVAMALRPIEVAAPRSGLAVRSKRIWRFDGKLLDFRQRQNRADACCGRKVFARREWTSK